MNNGTAKYYVISTVLQLAHVVIGAFSDAVNRQAVVLGVGIPLVIGAWYGAATAKTYGEAVTRGFLIGAIPALIGLIVAVLLGNVNPAILVLGTLSSALTGLIGALALFALVRRFPKSSAA